MISTQYQANLRSLRLSIDASQGGPFSIEPELSVLLGSDRSNPNLATDLLLSLSDDAHSGAMYALVHAAESLGPGAYLSTVLSVLPQLVEKSPSWALQLVRRIMHGEATFEELVRQIQAAPSAVKHAVQMVCISNDAIIPDYIPQEAKGRLAQAAS